MKKLLALMVSLSIVVVTCAGCGTGSSETDDNPDTSDVSKETAQTVSEPLKIGAVFSGFLGDKSYNDECYKGLQRAAEDFGIEYKVMESDQAAEWESNVIALASEDYDLIICVSSQFEDILTTHASEFADTKFALIDSEISEPNVTCVTFGQNEGSFLCGAAAAMFTTKVDIQNVNSDNIIGWVGGMDIPVINDFYVGFEQGAKYIDPDVTILKSYPGDFNDPLKAKEITLAQIQQGADIVMNVTNNGVLEACNDEGVYAIGVNYDQDSIYPGHKLTSMLKRVDNATYDLIKSLSEGTFAGGETIVADLSNGGVGITDMSEMKNALGDLFPNDIYDKITELTEQIMSGEIVVDHDPGFAASAK